MNNTKETAPADIIFCSPLLAFENAIEDQQLTENSEDDNFAGKYMYMHTVAETVDGWGAFPPTHFVDHFKNAITRKTDIKATRTVCFRGKANLD